MEFSAWLENEVECQLITSQVSFNRRMQPNQPLREKKLASRSNYPSATILHGASGTHIPPDQKDSNASTSQSTGSKPLPSCPYCGAKDHHLSVCPEFHQLDPREVRNWITTNNRCWRCARHHRASDCDLRKPLPKM